MKYAVRYLSKGGNTKKVALAIGEELGIKPESISKPLTEEVDILFLGTAVYTFRIDREMKEFINNLKYVKKVAIFATSALMAKKVYNSIRRLLKKKGIPYFIEHYYSCGEYNNVHKGRPNEDDLKRAKEFARNIVGERNE